MTKVDETARIGKTPQEQVAAETPAITAPLAQRQFMGRWGEWLGDPDRRYGHLHSARSIPAHTKLEMLTDPVIALCQGYIGATLVRAKRVIECTDENKRRFFEATFRTWEREFILQAALAAALGAVGLIKKFAFTTPRPVEIDAPPVWAAVATPYVIEGFDAVYPVGSSPRFDAKRRHFQGMNTPDGAIDVFYTLWLTIGKARAFGSYEGSGRLENVYQDWWMKYFGRDLYLVHLQKNIDRVAEVIYPPGTTQAGKSHRDIAVATGDAVRSGATVALPSSVYEVVDPMTSETKLSALRKWAIRFLEGSQSVGEFHEVDDHHDSKMALGYFVPPQMFMYVRQSSLGGPTTADVLGHLAEELLMLDAADIDTHVNKYVFPPIARANFSPGSPPVQVRTVGLEPDVRDQLLEVVKVLMARMETDTSIFDMPEALGRLGMPVRGQEAKSEMQEAGGREGTGLAAADEDDSPPREVLERMVQEDLTPVPGSVDLISDPDVRRAVRRLREVLPEVFEE